MVRVAAFAIVIKDNAVLLVKRGQTGYRDGEYGLPSGHIEAGELAAETIVRELKEETGLHANAADVQIAYVEQSSEDMEYVNFYGIVRSWSGEPHNTEPNIHAEVEWYPLDNLPETTIPYIRKILGELTRGVTYGSWNYERTSI